MALINSRFLRNITLLITIFSLSLPAYAQYSGGTGEPNDPYQIATATDLIDLGETPDDYDKHFILTDDIDLEENYIYKAVVPVFSGYFDGNRHVIRNMEIYSMNVYQLGLFGRLTDTAVIVDINLDNVTVRGSRSSVGGLVGFNSGCIVSCYCNGTVKGNYGDDTGGLVGSNYGRVMRSYSAGAVSGQRYVGGLVGRNGGYISSSNCDSSIHGEHDVGGLVGDNMGYIISSYCTGEVSGEGWSIGGLVGDNNYGSISTSYSTSTVRGGTRVGGLVGQTTGSLNMCYSIGVVTGNEQIGGLVGYNGGSISSCLWDIETSRISSSAGGDGKTTAQMLEINTYQNLNWDLVNERKNGTCDFWIFREGSYPTLSVFEDLISFNLLGKGIREMPYLITDANELGLVWQEPVAHYRLTDNINLQDITWNMALVPWFAGSFDANDFSIQSLRIIGAGYLGLFGTLRRDSVVSDLSIEEVFIEASGQFIGGLVGDNYGVISSSYCTGKISGKEWLSSGLLGGLVGENNGSILRCSSRVTVKGLNGIGGLVGRNMGSILCCYCTGKVFGRGNVGGLVGHNQTGDISASFCTIDVSGEGTHFGGLVGANNSNISSSYCTGTVSGSIFESGGLVGYNSGNIASCYYTGSTSGLFDIGGLVGDNDEGSVIASFWDIETSGLANSGGGTGKTTAEMQTASTFLEAGWDFIYETENGPNDVWKMWDGYDFPRLIWEPGPNTPLVFVDINDPGFYGQMSKYEVNNDQYCDFLNAALASGDITIDGNDVYGAGGLNGGEDYAGQRYYRCDGSGYTGYGATNGGAARIRYSEGAFRVDEGFINHPVTYVSWYGAMAFVNYYGYYLPTEEQWQAVADYDGTYIYGCGQIIDPGIANYRDSEHPDGTTPVGSFGVYGYGMSDMAGNIWEWTSRSLGDNRIFRGGSMGSIDSDCEVSIRGDGIPHANYWDIGFRVCR